MMENLKFVKMCVVVSAWMGILLAATHRSELPAVFGRYSWGYAFLLGTLVGIAAALSLAKSAWLVTLYQARSRIVLIATSFVVTILLLEIGIRAVDLYGISYYESLSDYARNTQADEHRVYRHKPSWEARFGDVFVTFNERGLRDRPILPKAQSEFRILALGDSLSFGWGVPQDMIFPARLELNLQGRLQRPVRVINAGVVGYNTVQEVTYFKQEGIALEPDLVMLTYTENDIEENKGPFKPQGDFTLRGLSLPGMVIEIFSKLWLYRLVDHAYHYAVYTRSKEQASNSSPRGQGWSDSMSALDELVAICKERKISLVIFYYRFEQDVSNSLFQDVLRHARGVPVKDVGQWFEGRDKFSLIISKVDTHPNDEAHRVMAEHMAEEIVNNLVVSK